MNKEDKNKINEEIKDENKKDDVMTKLPDWDLEPPYDEKDKRGEL